MAAACACFFRSQHSTSHRGGGREPRAPNTMVPRREPVIVSHLDAPRRSGAGWAALVAAIALCCGVASAGGEGNLLGRVVPSAGDSGTTASASGASTLRRVLEERGWEAGVRDGVYGASVACATGTAAGSSGAVAAAPADVNVLTGFNLLERANSSTLGWDCLADTWGCPNLAAFVSGDLKAPQSDLLASLFTTGGLPTSLMAYWPQVSGAPKAVSMLRAAACSRGNATCVVEHATEVKARNWTRVVSVDGHKFAAGIGLQLLLEFEDVNKNGVYDAGDDNFLSALDFSDPQLRWLPMTLEELHPNDNTTVLRLNASTVVIGKGIVALTYSATSNRVADPDYADSGGYLIPRMVELGIDVAGYNYKAKKGVDSLLAVQVFVRTAGEGSKVGESTLCSDGGSGTGPIECVALSSGGEKGHLEWQSAGTATPKGGGSPVQAIATGNGWLAPSADALGSMAGSLLDLIPPSEGGTTRTTFVAFNTIQPEHLAWRTAVVYGSDGGPATEDPVGLIVGISVAAVSGIGIVALVVWTVRNSRTRGAYARGEAGQDRRYDVHTMMAQHASHGPDEDLEGDRVSIDSRQNPAVPLLSRDAPTYATLGGRAAQHGRSFSTGGSSTGSGAADVTCVKCGYASSRRDAEDGFCANCGSRL